MYLKHKYDNIGYISVNIYVCLQRGLLTLIFLIILKILIVQKMFFVRNLNCNHFAVSLNECLCSFA